MIFTYSYSMNRFELYSRISGAGLAFFAAIIIGALVGQWLDAETGANGIFTILLLMLGLLGAVLNLLRTLKKLNGGKPTNESND